MNIFDTRWKGPHGIGRFATEVHQRLEGFASIGIHGRPSRPWDSLLLTQYLRSAAPRLFFSPGYNVPLGNPCPFVFCIHDLNHLFFRESSNVLKRAYYATVIRPAVARAELIFTVSEFSRRAICEWADVKEDKVIDVGNGVSEVFKPQGPCFGGADRPYFLLVGSHRPHKNFERVLRAFAASGLARDCMLVSTGEPTPQLGQLIGKLQLTGCVLFVGAVPEEDLAGLYRGALALIFASLYEGFGLPIVEAMACGTPVLTASVTSMPEVAGDAAILVDPYDVEAIRAALMSLTHDTRLRESLHFRGLQRARLYSWDSTARKVSDALAVTVS
jgi:glycosyltransferase involved in cell wall biosynthesis